MTDYTAYFGGQWMPFNEVRIDIVAQAKHYGPRENLESPRGS